MVLESRVIEVSVELVSAQKRLFKVEPLSLRTACKNDVDSSIIVPSPCVDDVGHPAISNFESFVEICV